jgi:TRAF3-interacting protein 1
MGAGCRVIVGRAEEKKRGEEKRRRKEEKKRGEEKRRRKEEKKRGEEKRRRKTSGYLLK